MSGAQISVILFGGAFGALARYYVSNSIMERLGTGFPYGTLVVNVIGSFFMGFLAMLLVEKIGLDPLLRLGLFVGFLGAFTTFSTFSMETMNLFQQGEHLRALINMFVNVLFSVLGIWLGAMLGAIIGKLFG